MKTAAAPARDVSTAANSNTAAETGAAETVAAAANYTPEFDEIARLAYSYWEARGGQGGSSEEDWSRAERELRDHRSFGAKA